MTCGACAARVQAKLNKVDGVTATVNHATERAHVTVPAHVSASDLVAVVEATGYSASLVRADLLVHSTVVLAAGRGQRVHQVGGRRLGAVCHAAAAAAAATIKAATRSAHHHPSVS
jgi:copper chaperone CopZ